MTFPLRFHDYDLIYNSSASCSTIEAHDRLTTELLMYACFSLSLIIMYILPRFAQVLNYQFLPQTRAENRVEDRLRRPF